jgi:hypothetical protein
MTDSRIEKIRILNAPHSSYSIQYATRVVIDSVIVDDSAGMCMSPFVPIRFTDPLLLFGDVLGNALGKNTDAFLVSVSNYLTINNATVHNQDDCVSVTYALSLSLARHRR